MNKDFILDLTKKILTIDSPSGYSKNVISLIKEYCVDLGISYELTKKGNLVMTLEGETDYTIGLSAHVDTLGAMVRSINSNGTLCFTSIGSPILPTFDGEYCKVYTRDGNVYSGTFLSNSPAIHVFEDSTSVARNAKNMHIRLDEIVKTKEDVQKLNIQTGDIIAIDPKTIITGNGFIKSRFLDDKMSVAILFGLIEHIKTNKITPKATLKFVISTYEEVGHGASYLPEMDELLAVDMGCIGLDLNCTEYDVSICAKDSSGPYDYDMTSTLIELAKKNKLQYAVDIYPMYGSDVSAAMRAGNNIKGALIGPGVGASHGMERTHWQAVENTLKLLIAYIKN